ncbi:MAG: tRNA (adenosine(37)-N6)-threonylcarbamoyltransferase complex dimerization subunit type 1 TsaB [Deltaproteobacteria bacterium]|nr:tRNA (adenosine(37)-N6)-threonylcarbamoyltransferase complex dimerization subunit type 1 TsaB [Deltaproteobacteria bacterium]
MLILAFDISSKTAAVSLLRDDAVLCDAVIDNGLNASEVLLPAVDDACRVAGVAPGDIDLFACTLGPGSFTGLRIGLSTLKGFMLATGKPAAGVSSLAALALNVQETGKVIGAMVDAGRGQVYLAYYRYGSDGLLRQLAPERAIAPGDIADVCEEGVIYVGCGAVKYADALQARRIGRDTIAPEEKQFICASSVGRLALLKYRSGDLLDLIKAVPVYLRSADAVQKKKPLL